MSLENRFPAVSRVDDIHPWLKLMRRLVFSEFNDLAMTGKHRFNQFWEEPVPVTILSGHWVLDPTEGKELRVMFHVVCSNPSLMALSELLRSRFDRYLNPFYLIIQERSSQPRLELQPICLPVILLCNFLSEVHNFKSLFLLFCKFPKADKLNEMLSFHKILVKEFFTPWSVAKLLNVKAGHQVSLNLFRCRFDNEWLEVLEKSNHIFQEIFSDLIYLLWDCYISIFRRLWSNRERKEVR